MTSRVSSSTLVLGATILLIVGTAVFVRFQKSESLPTNSAMNVPAGSIPEFTSTTFADGDLMKGLGPEWTYLRESELEADDARALPGLIPDREAVVKLAGEPVEMTLTEFDIEDQTKLDAALAASVSSTVQTRTGWMVPLNDIAGGEGFLLVGSRSALLISLSGSAEWPTELPSAVASFIDAIRVP